MACALRVTAFGLMASSCGSEKPAALGSPPILHKPTGSGAGHIGQLQSLRSVTLRSKSKVLVLTAAFLVVMVGATIAAVPQAGSRSITNTDIINLAKSGISDPIIIQTIEQTSESSFDTSPDGLINLKTAGVSDAVISAMIVRKRVVPATVVTSPTTGATPHSSGDRPAREIKGGILDDVKLYVDKPSARRVVIRPFSATDADVVNGDKKDETKTLQADGPRLLADRFVAKLKEIGPFASVSIAD